MSEASVALAEYYIEQQKTPSRQFQLAEQIMPHTIDFNPHALTPLAAGWGRIEAVTGTIRPIFDGLMDEFCSRGTTATF